MTEKGLQIKITVFSFLSCAREVIKPETKEKRREEMRERKGEARAPNGERNPSHESGQCSTDELQVVRYGGA